MDNVKKEETAYIDLRVLWRRIQPCLRRFWIWVLILAILGGVGTLVHARIHYRPMYQSEAVFSVSMDVANSAGLMDYSYYYDNTAAQQTVAMFPYLLDSDLMQELLCQNLDTDVIRGSISASAVAGTNFFVLTVQSADPEDAYHIINAVMEVYPQVNYRINGATQLVVDKEPVLATAPYNQFSWKRPLAKGAAGGLVLGLALIALIAMRRRTVITSADVKKGMNLTCLARVPDVRIKKRKKSTATNLLISRQDSESAFCESFRLLRLRLLRELTGEKKVILVTSTLPDEGKSTVAVNLAMELAQNEKRVLLVDADLRGPSVKEILNVSAKSAGLEKALADEKDISFLQYPNSTLFLYAGDTSIPDPTSLLRKEKLKTVIDQMRDTFDYVILDTPPCHMLADAVTIGACADHAVYVIREDYAPIPQIRDSVQTLSENDIHVCGYILTRASSGQNSRYGYGYGYGRYGYGSYGAKRKDKNKAL